jgi:hypothetical protein
MRVKGVRSTPSLYSKLGSGLPLRKPKLTIRLSPLLQLVRQGKLLVSRSFTCALS